jgi:hypothetical protein
VITQHGSFARAAPLALLVVLGGVASSAAAKTRAECEREYTPQRGQEGKDVIWVPTEDAMVVRMLEMAKVTRADKVYDLGAGDGKIAIAAGKRFGATAVGVEYDPALAKHAQCLVEAEGVQDRVEVVQGDIFETDFSDATVVTLYLLPALNLRLRPTLLEMKPGTRVVSYSFTMGDWEPDEYADTDDGSAYLWIVPADVGGSWTFRPSGGGETFSVTLEQKFQHLGGTAGSAAVTGKLSGERIDFSFTVSQGSTQGSNQEPGRESAPESTQEPTRVTGTVDGDRIRGTVSRGGELLEYVGTR